MTHPRPVFLTGFMAAGKTTIGRKLADILGYACIDLDDEIARETGQPIPELFAQRGEAEFRQLEADALTRVLSLSRTVVCTGGGAPCFHEGMLRMLHSGWVVHLDVSLETALARAGGDAGRPLLQRSPDELRKLYLARAPIYRQAHAVIYTDPHEVDDVVARVVRCVRILEETCGSDDVVVDLAERSYAVHFARDGWQALPQFLARCAPLASSLVVISDDHVMDAHGDALFAALPATTRTIVHTVTPGESAKSFASYARTMEAILAQGIDRKACIIAFGGGVVGDLAGFAAATLLRGIRFVQVPTTLLAVVDSSVGGKTGLNADAGKNLAGAFWQPCGVFVNLDALYTLPPRELAAAFGEVIKYGLLDSLEMFAAVETVAAQPSLSTCLSDAEFVRLVRRCVAYKASIVTRDERELTGARALLNLGHTVGHAIELAGNYKRYLHGEAVGLGLLAACRISSRFTGLNAEIETRVARCLANVGLPIELAGLLTQTVLDAIGRDKKRDGSAVGFVTLSDIGCPAVTPLPWREVVDSLLEGQ